MKKIFSILTVSLFLCSQLVSAEIITVGDEVAFKGLQRNPKADKIEDGSHSVFENVYVKDGNINVVKGRDKLNTTAHTDTTVNGMWYYESSSGTKKIVVAETDELVTYDTDGTSRTQIASSLTNEEWDATQIGDTLYLSNSTDGLHKWTGVGSATAVGSVSAPSSVDFSATSTTGAMTAGIDAVAGCCSGYTSSVTFTDVQTGDLTIACDDCGYGDSTKNTRCAVGEAADDGSGVYFVDAKNTTYKYKITKQNSNWGIESEASSSDSATLQGNDTIAGWCSSTVNIDPDFSYSGKQTATSGTLTTAPTGIFDEFCVYRTVANGDSYFKVGCQSTGTYNDGAADISLGEALDTTIDTIAPPSYNYIESYKGTIFAAEDTSIRFTRLPVEATTDVDTYWLETDLINLSSDKGSIKSLKSTNESLIIFTDRSIHEITGFGVDSFRLRNLTTGIGTTSNNTVETDEQGDIIFFAGTQGVYKLRTFQQPQDELTGSGIQAARVSLIQISAPVLDDVFKGVDSEIDLDPSDYTSANAYYDLENSLYFLYIGEHCLVFDNRNSQWSYIPAVSTSASTYRKSVNEAGQGVLLDDLGFMYDNWTGYENAAASGTVTGTPTSSASTTLTDSGATFNTTGDGLAGAWVFVDNDNYEYRQITSNTATIITVVNAWTTNPITTDDYYIGYIVPSWMTKQYQIAKIPNETLVSSFWIINNKSDSNQDLEFYTYENKSTTPSRQLSGEINLSEKFVNKVGSRLRSSWVQWEFRSFVYNTSSTISIPVDITQYAIDYTQGEAR